MGYAARIWGLNIGAYILIISGMIINGNLIWTDNLQQLEAAQKKSSPSMLLSLKIQQRHSIFLPIS